LKIMREEEKSVILRGELCKKVGITKRTIQRWIQAEKLPKYDIESQPTHPGQRNQGTGWRLRTLQGARKLPRKVQRFIQNSIQAKELDPSGEMRNQAPVLDSPEGGKLTGLKQIIRAEEQGIVRIGLQASVTVRPEYGTAKFSDLERVPEKIRLEMAKRLEVLKEFDKAQGRKEKEKALKVCNMRNPEVKISISQAYELHRKFRNEGASALIPKWKSFSVSSVPDDQYEYFKKMYLTQQQRGAAACRDLLSLQFKDLPSTDAFMRRLRREIPPHIIYYYRRGPAQYDRKFGCYAGRDYLTVAPGEIYVMDHHQIDVAVLGRDGRPFFPWATVCADIRSRKYLGWVLCPQPNTDTIHLAFRRACLRYGIPKEVLIDHGRDFRSHLFSGGSKRFRLQIDETRTKSIICLLGVIPDFAQPYNAKSKPIERSFLTLKERFSRLLPAFRGGDVTERPEELAEIIKSRKLIPIVEFERLYSGFVEAVFNNSSHRGDRMDGRTPNEVFAEGNVARAIDENSLSLLLYRSSRPAAVGKNGVTLFGRVYYADPLLLLKGQTVYLRFDPGEIGRVWVYTMKDEFICQAKENQLLSWHATEEDMRRVAVQRKKERRIIQAYHQITWDRSKEPDLVKALIAKKSQEHKVDLSPTAMNPEERLLASARLSQRDREKLEREEEKRRRELAREYCEPDPEPPREKFLDGEMKKYLGLNDFGT
jgi:putative transposase